MQEIQATVNDDQARFARSQGWMDQGPKHVRLNSHLYELLWSLGYSQAMCTDIPV